MDETKLDPKDLDSPGRELSNGGLGFVVAFPIVLGIIFLCARTEKASQDRQHSM